MIFDSANNNRLIVASRAAEIIMEEGVTDYLFAKKKAAKSLGLLTSDNLPSNHEIDNALKEYQNIFQEQVDSETIVKIKKEALNIMTLFKDFNPHLTGQLLEGLIPKFPKIQINLFTDNLKEVEYILLNKNIAFDIKKLYPNCIIVVGGEHPTALPENTLQKNDFIDVIILGEGEETFLNLIECIDKNLDYRNVKGIAYKNENGNIVTNERRTRITNIDDIPYPDWDNWSINEYIDHQQITGVNLGRGIPILGTRGCPYDCTFCSNDRMWTKRFIMRSPKNIVDEMEFMKKKYNVTAFSFMDSTFIINNKKVIAFCEELIKRDISVSYQLPAGTRCEAINQELVNFLEKSGLEKLSLAPESGSEEIRKIIKKKIDYKKFIEAVKMLSKSKISVGCFIVIGFPEDNKKQFGKQ